MDRESQKRQKRLTLMRTIDNKRTISSQQSYMNKNGRKYTLENNELRQKYRGNSFLNHRPNSIGRKNQSLPRALSSLNDNKNIRTRKLNFNALQTAKKQSSQRLKSTKTQISSLTPQQKTYLEQAIKLYTQHQYQKAIIAFMNLNKQTEDKNTQIMMYLGLSYYQIHKNNKINLDKPIYYLAKCLNNPESQLLEEVYSSLTNAYELTHNYICAINTVQHHQQQLNEWIQKHQRNSQAYLTRARLNIHFKEYQKALYDYRMCYKYNIYKLQAYIEQAQIVYKIQGIQAALEKYNLLLINYKKIWPQSQYSDINYVKYKKSILLIQQKQYPSALKLLTNIDTKELLSQIHYYIGIINSILGKVEQSMLSYQKSIMANTSQKFVLQSYYEKFVIMFKKYDYYGIQHELDIIKEKYNYSENQSLNMIRTVTQGIIYVLKMNFNEGIQILNECIEDSMFKKNQKVYKHIIFSFMAFSYYSIREFHKSLMCLDVIGKRLSQSNVFNYYMVKAIINSQNKEYSEAITNINKAQKIQQFNNHTTMVKAIIQILFYNSIDKDNNTKNNDILLSAQELLSKCLLKQRQNDKVLYLIGVICYELQQYEQGIKFIRKAIQTSDDHTIKHYYLKANIKVMLDMVEQAINDYTNALIVIKEQQNIEQQKQEPIPQCYLQRAKCYLLTNQKDKAQSDLRLFYSDLQNVKSNKQDLSLFMHVGASQVILQIYKKILASQGKGLHIVEDLPIKERMKCYYLAKQLNSCLQTMDELLQFNQQESLQLGDQQRQSFKLNIDRQCLYALKISSQGSNMFISDALKTFQKVLSGHMFGDIFTKADCLFFAGVMQFNLKQYLKAKNYFIDSKAQKLMNNEIQNVQKGSQEEQEQYQNRTYTMDQVNYNIGVCDFIQGKWTPYLDQYEDFVKIHKNLTQDLLQSNQQITPFPIKNRLCSIYSPQTFGNAIFRLSFCLPKIKLKPVVFNKNKNIIRSVSLNDIDMRPSAPWIVKNKNGIMFTDELMKDSVDLRSEKSTKFKRNKKGQNRYKEESDQSNRRK